MWRALTEPQLLERWLRMPNDIKPVVGHRFELLADPVPAAGFAGGPVACEVLAVEPERLLSISWGPEWTVTWRLEPEGRGTRLFLSHEGFDPDDEFQRMSRRIMGRRPAHRRPQGVGARAGRDAGLAAEALRSREWQGRLEPALPLTSQPPYRLSTTGLRSPL
ncbi:SRPBCC family protein [Amycolatopsis speibonae]|uniref:SRPBCC domain-containing protein n=1 Tax=Amycolatopsis speibonae TaxID=1450224 RepID=A0ABV7P0M0_9PSEU